MKVKRYKRAKKVLSFYKNTFGYREPYQVLIDGTFCQAALKGKIQLKEQIPKYFGGTVQLVTTGCVCEEIRRLGQEFYGAFTIAKRFSQRSCGHLKKHVSATECLLSMIGEGNLGHFIVGSQDSEVQTKLRSTPGVALVHIVRNTLVLETPSDKSETRANQLTKDQTDLTGHEKAVVEALDKEAGLAEVSRKRRKMKGPKGPNPLSVKKKKTKSHAPVLAVKTSTRNQRRRARLQKLRAVDIADVLACVGQPSPQQS